MTEVIRDSGDKLGPAEGAASSLHGNAMLLQLQQGWKPLPLATLFELALGGLRVRLTRSIVTMLSIVLAIAFLTYTGLSNKLTYRLAVQLEELEKVRPMPSAELRRMVGGMLEVKPFVGLPVEQRLQIARDMGMDNNLKLESEIVTLPQSIRRSKDALEAAEKRLAALQADSDTLRVDLDAAEKSVEESLKQVKDYEDNLVLKRSQAQLARWIGSGGVGSNSELVTLLDKQLGERYVFMITAIGFTGRLPDTDLKLLEEKILPLPAVATAPEVNKLREAMATEHTMRAATELRNYLRLAAVNTQLAITGNPMDYWLIVMAMMTCAVGIANAMLMSVTERFREIGTMKCLGAQDNLVVKLFLLESGVLGIVGAVLGIVLGVAVALLAAVLQFGGHGTANFPISDGMVVILLSILGGVMLSVAGAVYPAYSASRMRPVDALRVDE